MFTTEYSNGITPLFPIFEVTTYPMKKDVTNTDDYIALVEPLKKECFDAVHSLIQSIAPNATLSYKYNMLHFSLEEQWIALADQKHFVGLYLNQNVILKYNEELKAINCGKSCLRLKPNQPIPSDILKVLIQESLF